ncbi:ABC transporter substrate-binding protein [Acetivibrio sp. MSJd-27]|jgi:putative solute-binding lipoprotein|uniref:ABC transporter substrate-binding protein n=1 Tax=Acetivibrio sp. MSJd-27 TaxID=2841523 RepID=UPI0015B27305|nr:ABC transporter substrate-binding protein [Acetivibrio sp. MSJd-27]MBU5450942.1 ABC transporter substrate-binding protein [Acetivibrio sp. MSJd-27]
MKKVICTLLFALLLCGCAGEEGQTTGLLMSTQTPAGTSGTVYLLGYNFESENPLLSKNTTNQQMFSLIYDSLYGIDEKFEPTESLAAGITMNSDRQYTVVLKPGVTFHDGTLLTSSDVVSTVEFLLKNETSYRYHVRNIASVSRQGDEAVRFQLKEPAQNFKAQLTFPIVSAKMLNSGDTSMNGTGKYKVENYVQRKKITLAYNDNYFEKANPEVKRIEIQLVPDKETANYAYSSGLADVYMQDILDNSTSAVSKSGAATIEYTGNEYGCMLFQMNNPIFQDVNVRRAILLGINRDKLITDVLFSHAVKAETPVNPVSYLVNQNVKSEYNVEQAKALLKESGWESDPADGLLKKSDSRKETLKFSLLINNTSEFKKQLAANIKEDMSYLGIEVNVIEKNFADYEKDYRSGKFDAVLINTVMGFDYDFTSFLATGKNICNYSDDMTDLILKNIGETDGTEKVNYFQRLQENFQENVPHISLYYTKTNLLSTSKLKKGLNPTAFSIYHNIENWSFRE